MSVLPKISTRILISSDFHWYGTRKHLFMTVLDLKFLIRMQGKVCECKTRHLLIAAEIYCKIPGSMFGDNGDLPEKKSAVFGILPQESLDPSLLILSAILV
jgi:hypothetical protein